MAQGLSTPDPSLSPTHLSIRRGRTTTTHYTHHQVSLVLTRNTTLVPSLGLRIRPACEQCLLTSLNLHKYNLELCFTAEFITLVEIFHLLHVTPRQRVYPL